MPDNPGSKVSAFFKQHKLAAWGIIGIGGIAAVMIWRRQASQSASSQPASDTSGTSAIDSQTGYPAGSPEDEQALMDQSGYSTGFGYDPFASGFDPFAVPTGGGGGTATTTSSTPASIQNNDQWLTAAENTLPNGHSSTVETALTSVLGGLSVTWSQRALFLEAKGVLGDPPGGYPTQSRSSTPEGTRPVRRRKCASRL